MEEASAYAKSQIGEPGLDLERGAVLSRHPGRIVHGAAPKTSKGGPVGPPFTCPMLSYRNSVSLLRSDLGFTCPLAGGRTTTLAFGNAIGRRDALVGGDAERVFGLRRCGDGVEAGAVNFDRQLGACEGRLDRFERGYVSDDSACRGVDDSAVVGRVSLHRGLGGSSGALRIRVGRLVPLV